MTRFRILITVSAMAAVLEGCAGMSPVPPASTALVAPSPPGWFAFCAVRLGAGDPACDPVPRATAMAEGPRAPTPAPWRDFCSRHASDPACSR